MNASNLHFFYGRLTKDAVGQMKGQGQNQYLELKFGMAVNRVLSKEKKDANAAAKQANPNIASKDLPYKDADFVNMYMTGALAQSMQPFLVKGKPMGFWCEYESWESTNTQTGQTEYGHRFKVVAPMFSQNDNTNGQNNGAGYGANNYNQPMGGGYQAPPQQQYQAPPQQQYQAPQGGYQTPAAAPQYQNPGQAPQYQNPGAPPAQAPPMQYGAPGQAPNQASPQQQYQAPGQAPAPGQQPQNGAAPNYQVDDNNLPF